jgi:hypothetical protein
MAKKQQSTRRERSGGGTGTATTTSISISRAKQAATKRRGGAKNNDAASSNVPSTTQLLFALVPMLALASVLLLIAPFLPLPTPRLVGNINHDDDELLKTREFLSNFVCNYKPKSTSASDVHVDGYCHPKLVAVPNERTQRVAYDDYTSDAQIGSNIYSRTVILQQWVQITLNKLFFTTTNKIAIPAGELVMRLPRPLQFWDLDALRDEFIQAEFLGLSKGNNNKAKAPVTHRETGNPLDSGAYLAVHLIRLIHGLRGGQCNDSESQEECKQPSNNEWTDVRQYQQRMNLLEPYLDILPARHYDTTAKPASTTRNPHDHPLTWSKSTLESLFPKYTHTYDLIVHYRRMIQSEYDALGQASEVFAQNVEFSEYLNMRVNVLSRAFGVSASENDSGAQWNKQEESANESLLDEMKSYETSNFGSYLDNAHQSSDTSFRLRSMSPLLDMYNSHPNPNVLWRYNEKTSSYDIRASNKNSISPGDEIMVSYGKYTEGHLFAKFGYVNGDGSSPTEANLAVFHRPLGDVGLGRQYSLLPFHAWDLVSSPKDESTVLEQTKQVIDMQSKELIRYLIFDDGYKECVRVSDNEEYNQHEELKLLKLQHLIRIANQREHWVVRLPAKFPDAKSPQSLSERPETGIETSKVGVNANRMLSTCRLLSLTVDDIGRDAVDYLRDGLSSNTFEVEKDDPALEYRAMMCVARMCGVAMSRYGEYLTPQGRQEPREFGSRGWNAWYVREGEMRVLGILRQTLLTEANKLKRQHNLQNDAAITVRENGACPIEYSLPLLGKIS